jgi:hypothetical protein
MDIMGHDQPLLCCIFVLKKYDWNLVKPPQKATRINRQVGFISTFSRPRFKDYGSTLPSCSCFTISPLTVKTRTQDMPSFCPSSEVKRWPLNYFVLHMGIQCRCNIVISFVSETKQHLNCSTCLPQLGSLWLVIRNLPVSLTMFRSSEFGTKQAFLKSTFKMENMDMRLNLEPSYSLNAK